MIGADVRDVVAQSTGPILPGRLHGSPRCALGPLALRHAGVVLTTLPRQPPTQRWVDGVDHGRPRRANFGATSHQFRSGHVRPLDLQRHDRVDLARDLVVHPARPEQERACPASPPRVGHRGPRVGLGRLGHLRLHRPGRTAADHSEQRPRAQRHVRHRPGPVRAGGYSYGGPSKTAVDVQSANGNERGRILVDNRTVWPDALRCADVDLSAAKARSPLAAMRAVGAPNMVELLMFSFHPRPAAPSLV